jgi:hypothetical protein
MSPKKSHTITVTDNQLRLFEAVENDPALLSKLTEVLERFNQEVDSNTDAYTAELRIEEAVNEIAKSMVIQWADKAQQAALGEALKDPDQIKNGKKNSTGTAPSEE